MKGDKAEKKAAKAAKKEEQAKKKAAKKAVSAGKKAERMKKQAEIKAAREEKKAKRRIEQQEKRAEKLAQKAGDQMEETGKKKKNKKILLLIPVMAAAGAALVYFLVIPKLFPKAPEEPEVPEPIDAPVAYQLGSASIPALPAWGEVLVYEEEPAPLASAPDAGPENLSTGGEEADAGGEEADAGGEEAQQPAEEEAAEPTQVIYRYEGYTAPRALAVSYAELMTTEDAGFSFVDEELVRLKEEEYPDLEAPSGSAYLARNSFTEEDAGKAMTIRLAWTEEICRVTLDLAEGAVKDPPPPPSQTPGGMVSMSAEEAVDYIYTMEPEKLGLAGESMEEYSIYTVEGVVIIDGIPCMRINIYRQDGQGGNNQIAGNFFMSSDGQHIYQLDVDADRVTELDITD